MLFLVGAAGFEPATWSTQNSRATRLRYTPPRAHGRETLMPTPRKDTYRYTLRPTAATYDVGHRALDRPPSQFPRAKIGFARLRHSRWRNHHHQIWLARSRRNGQRRKIGVATRSPASIPSFLAVPATTSRTARTGPPEEMILSDSVWVFSAMRRMRPSLWMKIMSRDT